MPGLLLFRAPTRRGRRAAAPIDTPGPGLEDAAVQSQVRTRASASSRIVAHEDRLAEAAAEVLDEDAGRIIRQPAFPHVFDANLVRHPRLDEARLDAQLARLEAPLRAIGAQHIQLACDAAPVGEGLSAALRARGFQPDRLLAMVLEGRPARPARPDVEVRMAIDGALLAEYADTMERLCREEPWYSPIVAREIVGSQLSKARAGVFAPCVARQAGRTAGAAGLSLDGRQGVAAICSVGTLPAARHRGVAQSMVVTLAERALAAGCDLVYLLARADDTPKEMYRKLGFETAFAFETWLRPPR